MSRASCLSQLTESLVLLRMSPIFFRSQFSNFSITNILGEEEIENGTDASGERISRIKQEKIDILGIPTRV